jgi:hypothetical protein
VGTKHRQQAATLFWAQGCQVALRHDITDVLPPKLPAFSQLMQHAQRTMTTSSLRICRWRCGARWPATAPAPVSPTRGWVRCGCFAEVFTSPLMYTFPPLLDGSCCHRHDSRPCDHNVAWLIFHLGLQALGSRAWLVLSSCMQPVALQPGHDLCQQGASADRLWFLTEGDDTMVAVLPHEKRACMQAALPCWNIMCKGLMIVRRSTCRVLVCAGSMLAIAHGRSMARITAPAVLGESALLAALAQIAGFQPLTYRQDCDMCTRCLAAHEQPDRSVQQV